MARMFYDEMHDAGGECRSHYREFARWLADTPEEQLLQRRREADLLFHRAGITFTLYGDEQGTERLIPFDTIPRSIPAAEWAHIEAGCIQRVQALNLFLADLYHEQRILKAGVIPAEQVLANDQYQLAMQGLDLPIAKRPVGPISLEQTRKGDGLSPPFHADSRLARTSDKADRR